MARPGMNGLDTPATQAGDATYVNRQPDFDMTQEPSFQSPSKDAQILQQLRNGRKPSLRTPRTSRAPFAERKNLQQGGGAEFTPLLKSATRNNARRYSGKENGVAATPAFLDRIDEDMTALPAGESSIYMGSRNGSSYLEGTPLPVVDSSSVASTPLVMRTDAANGKSGGPLQDGHQLSLREQENVIDRIEKENFGLKLKIHFLEDALRKAGPGFSQAALKENTDLKVDQVTMQRELQRYKKHLTTAERELERYRVEITEMAEKAKRKVADEALKREVEELRRGLAERDSEIQELRRQVRDAEAQAGDAEELEKLRDEIGDLEAEIRSKDIALGERDDQVDALQNRVEDAEEATKDAQRRIIELEEKTQAHDELEEAKETIDDLEATVRRLEQQVDDMKDKIEEAVAEKDRAEGDLEELQEEMANKSTVTKGLSRQVEEKVARLQSEVDRARQELADRDASREAQQKEIDELKARVKDVRQERDVADRVRQSLATKLEELQAEFHSRNDEKALLQTRHESLTDESASLQREVAKLQKSLAEAEAAAEEERQHSLDVERDIRAQFKDEIEELNDEISNLQAEGREKDNLYDNDSEKWEAERHSLESERDRAEEKAAGLQRTIDKLREAEGSLSSKESALQAALQSETDRHKSEEAALSRQIEDLRGDLDSRQRTLEDLRNEITTVRDALRQSKLDSQAQAEKVQSLEDEVEVLQSALDEDAETARKELLSAQQEADNLRQQLRSLQSPSRRSPRPSGESLARLQSQLQDATDSLTSVRKEKQVLQDQLATVNVTLHTLQASLAETRAERDELQRSLNNLKEKNDDTLELDRERVTLRTTKVKLDSEIRRLKEENRSLTEQRQAIEKALEEEMEKATIEEERLNREVLELQSKLRQGAEGQELVSARRTIRELERKLEDQKIQLALHSPVDVDVAESDSGISVVRKDLSAARQKEVELLKREAAQKDMIKTLKRQVSDLERRAHEAELAELMTSPSTVTGGSAHKNEIAELRQQVITANQTVYDLKKSLREAKRQSSGQADLESRLADLEEQKLALEEALTEAQNAADDAAITYEQTVAKYKAKMQQYRRERDELAYEVQKIGSQREQTGEMEVQERRELHEMLKQTQIDADALEHEVQELREVMGEMQAKEEGLRVKLERARSERAVYRSSAERLGRDVKALKQQHEQDAQAQASQHQQASVRRESNDVSLVQMHGAVRDENEGDTHAIVRAAEAAEQRHVKEMRGMSMQLEWLRAAWDREVQLRDDAAFAKRYLLLQLDVRETCNKVDLAMLHDIHSHLRAGKARRNGSLPTPNASPARIDPKYNALPLAPLPASRAVAKYNPNNALPTSDLPPRRQKRPFNLQRMLIVVRFIARTQIAAGKWAKMEKIRFRFLEAVEEKKRMESMDEMARVWRAEHGIMT